MASSDSQIDKPKRGRPKRAELPDVNINTGAQSINTERASLIALLCMDYYEKIKVKILRSISESKAAIPFRILWNSHL